MPMLVHFLRVAGRSFLARKLHTFVNVLGLALGFTCFIGAYVFVHYVRNADQHFSNADRIHVVFQRSSVEALALDDVQVAGRSSSRLAQQLRIDLPELEAVARATTTRELVVSNGDNRSFRRVQYAEPSFLEIFGFDFLYGSNEAAAEHVRSAILTQQAALAMFERADVVGESIELSDGESIAISGVISAIPTPSHLGESIFSAGFEVLVTSAVPEDMVSSAETSFGEQWEWLSPSVYTYVMLPADRRLSIEGLNQYLAGLGSRQVDPAAGRIELDARPVSHVVAEDVDELFWNDYPVSVTGLILLLGATVLAIASVNFVNLATAAVTQRTREVAIRKIVGASRMQVVLQYLIEAALTAAFALCLALVALRLALPAINSATQSELSIPWSIEFGWLLIGIVVACGLLVGIYPALLLGRMRPTQALRASGGGTGSHIFRSVLITAQFTAASFLVIFMLVVQQQNAELREAGLHFVDDPFVVLEDTPDDVGVDAETLRSALLQSPAILDVTGANSLPWEAMVGGTSYSRSLDTAVEAVFTQQRRVTFDYFDVLGLRLLAGMPFTVQRQALLDDDPDSFEGRRQVVLDPAAVEQFGWSNPSDAVGQVIYSPAGLAAESRVPVDVIGVVGRPPFEFLGWGFEAFAYEMVPSNGAYPIIRIASNAVGPALSHIDSVWQQLVPHSPIRREFVDVRFQAVYGFFETINRGLVAMAGLGLGVAAMGLFGIAVFVTGRRRSEVGIRKTMGASATRIAVELLRDFSKPVIVTTILAWPLGFMAATAYLSTFVQRAELGPEPFLASLGLTILVALVAVASQVIAAAKTQPARVLRHE